MKTEYDLAKMKPRKNPYARKLKKQIALRLDPNVIEYFEALSPVIAGSIIFAPHFKPHSKKRRAA